MSNNSRGVMKIPTAGFADAASITSRVATEKGGVGYETIDVDEGRRAARSARRDQHHRARAFGRRRAEPRRRRASVTSRRRGTNVMASPQERGRPAALFFLCWPLRAPRRPRRGPRAHRPQHATRRAPTDRRRRRAGRHSSPRCGRPSPRSSGWRCCEVSVGADQPPMIGAYPIDDGRIAFTPMFPLDPGRQYHVTFMPRPAPRRSPRRSSRCRRASTTPTTMVAQVFPTAEVVPENQLRLYIHFSAPMGSKGGLDYVHLLDENGERGRRIRSCRSTPSSGTTIARATPCSSIRAARSAASRRSPTWADR